MTTDSLFPPRLSPSQIRTLLTCPRSYLFDKVLGIKSSNSDAEYFILGRAFDDLMHGADVARVDLRPLDESKKDYRAMLSGMLAAVRAKFDCSKLQCAEMQLRTETETMKVDGLYVDGNAWWLVEIKTASASKFVIEDKVQLLKRDTQLAGYVAKKDLIADLLMLDVKQFKGIKYIWALKPTKKKDPVYEAHVVELTEKDLCDPAATWRTAKGYAKLIQDVIRTTWLQRNEISDVPMNPTACSTFMGDCGYYEQCYGRKCSSAGNADE